MPNIYMKDIAECLNNTYDQHYDTGYLEGKFSQPSYTEKDELYEDILEEMGF